MTAYKITTANSVYLPNGTGFVGGSPAADSLTIDQGAYVVVGGLDNSGVQLSGAGAWTFTLNGLVLAPSGFGMILDSPGTTSNITLGTEAEVWAGSTALAVNSSVNIKNAGLISGNSAIFLAMTGKSTITNSGEISGHIRADTETHKATITNSGTIDGYIFFVSDGNKVTNTGNIFGAVAFSDGNNFYTATGTKAWVDGITAFDGDDTVSSSGATGDISLGGGKNTIKIGATGSAGQIITGNGNDTLSISGLVYKGIHLSGGNDTINITSTGTVDGPVTLFGGNAVLSSAGTVTGLITMAGPAPKYTNSGTQIGDVNVALNGNSTVVNSGSITGNITLGIAADILKNSKLINGNINLLDGADVLTNSGSIVGSVNFGAGNDDDVLNNSGVIYGSISLGAGNDKVTNTGFAVNFVDLGAGDDLYTGGAVRDRVLDSDGSDKISLGGGDDQYGGFLQGVTADGSDIIDGGAGNNDSYIIDPEVGDLRINLDTVAHDIKVLIVPSVPVAANTAFIQDAGSDKISNFEHVASWEGNDVIFGNAAVNFLSAGDGHDYIFGLGGNDKLVGGGGNDAIVGGIGADVMSGEAGIDSFLWTATNESGNTKATRDVIKDFEDNVDFINFSLIDAFTPNGAAIDDAFVYINGNSSTTPSAMFTKVAGQGQLRSYWTTDGHIIEADVNADGKSDFSIAVYDPTHVIQFTQSDFIVS